MSTVNVNELLSSATNSDDVMNVIKSINDSINDSMLQEMMSKLSSNLSIDEIRPILQYLENTFCLRKEVSIAVMIYWIKV